MESNIVKLKDEFNKRRGTNYSTAKVTDKSRPFRLGNESSSVFADMGTTSWGDVDDTIGENFEKTDFKTVDEMRLDQQKMLRGLKAIQV